MLKRLATVLIAVCLVVLTLPARAITPEDSAILTKTIGCSGETHICVIRGNDGGQFQYWLAAFPITFLHGIYLVIDNECNSGCELFAEWLSSNVCVTSNATFGFHQAYNVETDTYKQIPHNNLIQQLLDKKGGAPASREHEDLLVINSAEVLATGLWRHCEIENNRIVFK